MALTPSLDQAKTKPLHWGPSRLIPAAVRDPRATASLRSGHPDLAKLRSRAAWRRGAAGVHGFVAVENYNDAEHWCAVRSGHPDVAKVAFTGSVATGLR